MSEQPIKTYPTISCCGLDCGLCPRYYTKGSSRCPGCCGPDFFNKHPSCSYITCCVKKKNLEVCAQCDEFPCLKFGSSHINGGKYDSFITYKKAHHNLNFIRTHSLEKFIEQQKDRIKLLEKMLKYFDDGRSKSYYCIVTTLLSIKDLEKGLDKTTQKIRAENIELNDVKTKAKILKEFLNDLASRKRIELKLRKKAQINTNQKTLKS